MEIKECKRLAREILKNRWRQIAVMSLIYFLICFVALPFISNLVPTIGMIITSFIIPVLAYGFTNQLIKLKNEEEVGFLDFIKLGFGNWQKAFCLSFRFALKITFPVFLCVIGLILLCLPMLFLIPPLLFLVVAEEIPLESVVILQKIALGLIGIAIVWITPIALKYRFINNELVYNPDKTVKEILKISSCNMKGNRLKLLLLILSFAGWFVLSVLLFGIPLVVILPYMQIASIIFYEHVSGKSNRNENENVSFEMSNVIVE